jgi:hypothetical protein
MLDRIEEIMNGLSDMDMGWWPLLFLRPAQNKDITNLVLIKLTLTFGSFLGFLMCGLFYQRLGGLTFGDVIISFGMSWLLFFISYKITFAYFWNRRARRLRGEK